MSERFPLAATALVALASAYVSVRAKAPVPRVVFAVAAVGCVSAIAVALKQPPRIRRPWLWGLLAAFIAIAGFAPVFCVEGSSGGGSSCTGLFVVPTNVAIMGVMALFAFVATAEWLRRHPRDASRQS